jgi:hypothetical protein
MPKSPCPEGQTRNRVTRTCRDKKRRGRPAGSGRAPCPDGQTRNRVTKKCRDKKRRGRPAKVAARVASATPRLSPAEETEFTYRVDLYLGDRPVPTDKFIEMNNDGTGGCADGILDHIFNVAQPEGATFFDAKMFPEDDYATIISDVPLKKDLLNRKMTMHAFVPDCSKTERIGFKISML